MTAGGAALPSPRFRWQQRWCLQSPADAGAAGAWLSSFPGGSRTEGAPSPMGKACPQVRNDMSPLRPSAGALPAACCPHSPSGCSLCSCMQAFSGQSLTCSGALLVALPEGVIIPQSISPAGQAGRHLMCADQTVLAQIQCAMSACRTSVTYASRVMRYCQHRHRAGPGGHLPQTRAAPARGDHQARLPPHSTPFIMQ